MPAASYNELFGLGSHSPDASVVGWWPLQDNAASVSVVDRSGQSRTLTSARNTSLLAATGPNGYLSSSFLLNGTSDNLGWASAITWGTSITGLARIKTSASSGTVLWGNRVSLPSASSKFIFGVAGGKINFSANSAITGTPTINDGSWKHIAFQHATTGTQVKVDGTNHATTASDITRAGSGELFVGFNRFLSSDFFGGNVADVAVFTRYLSDSEVDEHRYGPELVNSAAPSVSGTASVGQTLSCTTGTWALPSPFSSGTNGIATYSYQWTRSNSAGGSGEANISAATSSTYTLQSADAGKYVRCRVRATNSGGYDSAADTNSNMVTVASFNPAWAARCNQYVGLGAI